MKIGIVGCGLMGRQRARSLALIEGGHRAVAVYDPDQERARALAEESGPACRTASSLEELLSSDAEAVIVAVPHWKSSEAVQAALAAGKHVLCEKPLGLSSREARRLAAQAAQAQRQLTVGFNYRFYPGFQEAARVLREGVIGTPTHARLILGHGARPGYEREWKTSREHCGGGALLDPGIHALDLARHLFGEVRTGTASLWRAYWPIDVEDNAFLAVDAGGVQIQMHISITEWKSQCRLDVFGAEGMLSVEGRSGFYGAQKLRLTKRWGWLSGADQDEIREYPSEDLSFARELAAFFERIQGRGDGQLAGPPDGIRALELVEQLYQSARPAAAEVAC